MFTTSTILEEGENFSLKNYSENKNSTLVWKQPERETVPNIFLASKLFIATSSLNPATFDPIKPYTDFCNTIAIEQRVNKNISLKEAHNLALLDLVLYEQNWRDYRKNQIRTFLKNDDE